MKNSKVILSFLLLTAFVIRLCIFFSTYRENPLRMTAPDTISYEKPALALVKTGRYSKSPEQPTEPEVMRTPGYPSLIAVSYALFGQSRPILMTIQILMSIATIALLYFLVRHWFGEPVALGAATLLILDPSSFLSSQMMLSETPFTLFFLMAAWAGAKLISQEGQKQGWAFLLGLALAISAQFRPIALYVIYPVLIGIVIVYSVRGTSIKKVAPLLAMIIIPWAILVWGWQIRNWMATGKPEFTYLKNHNLLMDLGGHIVEMRDHVTFEQAQERIKSQLPDVTGWPIPKVDQLYHDRAVALIKQNPVVFVKVHVIGVARIMFGPASRAIREYMGMNQDFSPIRELRASPGQFFRKLAAYPSVTFLFFFELAFMTFVFAGIIVAAWMLFRNQRALWPIHLFWLGLIIYMLILGAGSQTNYRFRVPISPLLMVYSVIGWSAILGLFKGRREQ